MRNQDPKAFPNRKDRGAKVEGFGNPESRSGSTARPDSGVVPPVDPVPDAGTAKPDGGHRKRRRIYNQPLSEPERALAKDAQQQARQLKREHRALYTADPRHFRKIVRLAQSAVFRQKPGPKPDRKAARRIAHAARRRARGAKWPELYERSLPGWRQLNPVTRNDAEDGFRRKVNKYLQSHRRLHKADFFGNATLSSTWRSGMVRSAVVPPDERFPCPCCCHLTLDEPPPGTYLICDVCGWEDDPVQFDDIDYEVGANRVSLRQAREFYRSIGMSSPERLQKKQLSDPGRLPQ
jgi:hypothetical protein